MMHTQVIDGPAESPQRTIAVLRALLAIATELAELQDVESVLQSIVRRTRVLLGTDMAYVSLNDYSSGETYIRQSDGVVTHGYRTIRMPIGTGILGQVASGLAPFQSDDYLLDATVPHLDSIDEIVRDEGVAAIMGAPLVREGTVIGALMVAHRSPRVFRPSEIDTVSSLGTYAVIALENAQKYEEAVHDLQRAGESVRREQHAYAALTDVLEFEERLLAELSDQPSIERILQFASLALQAPLVLLDADGQVQDSSARDLVELETLHGLYRWGSEDLVTALRASEASGRAQAARPRDSDGQESFATVVPVRVGHRSLGFIVTSPELPSTAFGVLERIATHLALALLYEFEETAAIHREQSEFVEELMSGSTSSSGVKVVHRLRAWGMAAHDSIWVAVVEDRGENSARMERVLRGIRGSRIVARHGDHWCVLHTEATWAARAQEAFVAAGLTFRCGGAGPVQDISQVAVRHRRALAGLRSLDFVQRDGFMDGESLGLVSYLMEQVQSGAPRADIDSAVSPLVDYDRDHGTELCRTAHVYLEADRNIGRTAELLYIHRNTVRQRLETITGLMGEGWNSAPRSLDVHLALRAWSVTQT